jgi:hypothetical protein
MHPRQPDVPGESPTNVFLAYASDDQTLAYAVRHVVQKYVKQRNYGDIQVHPWQWTSGPGKSILQNILDNMKQSEFGIFIFSPTVVAMRGNSERLVPVDNVVYEVGLFTGMKGIERALILLPEECGVAPTDLGGILGIPYDHSKFDRDKTYEENEPVIWDTCVRVTNHIHDVMAQQEPSASQSLPGSQPLPDTGQVSADAGQAQLNSPLEELNVTLRARALQNSLRGLRDQDVERWRLVVHPAYGVGQVMAFDPAGQRPRYITVRFGSWSGVFDIVELHVAQESAD